jgi:hypothetical protein
MLWHPIVPQKTQEENPVNEAKRSFLAFTTCAVHIAKWLVIEAKLQ